MSVKRQFVRIQPSKVNSDPQQAQGPVEWSPQANAAMTPPREAFTPPQAPQNWGNNTPHWQEAPSAAPASYNTVQYSPTDMRQNPGQRTDIPHAPVRPKTGPVGHFAPPQAYRPSSGQLPPSNPGIWPSAPPAQQSPTTSPQTYRPSSGQLPPSNPGVWPSAPPAQQSPIIQGPPSFAQQAPPYGPPSQSGLYPWSQPNMGPMGPNRTTNNFGPPMQPPGGRPMPGKKQRRKRRFPIWARVAVALLAVLLVAAGSGFAYYQVNFAASVTKITGQQAAQIGADGQSTGQMITTGNGIGNKRVNILLLGSDNDGKNAAPLAQTDIVVTVDPQTNYVGMLSIPRDMRVAIPGQGMGKMDAAFSLGWQSNYGGTTPLANAAGLSIATVEKNFGMTINYYAWVGLDGFVKVINTAGGVEIDATHPIADNSYPNDVNNANHFDYERLYITPGPQHMDGVHALSYVRTRHADLVGDFGRSARQQQVLSQLKTKLDTPAIISKLSELANDLGDTVKTSMSIQDIINFMGFARAIDPNKVDRLILSPPYSSPAPDKTGDYLPNCTLIMPQVAKMFQLGNNANCITAATPNTTNSSTFAANHPNTHTSTSASVTSALSNTASTVGQTLSLLSNGPQSNISTTGVHSLLDMMFMVVFESFDAAQV